MLLRARRRDSDRLATIALAAALLATSFAATIVVDVPAATAASPGFDALAAPRRVLDTRAGEPTVDGAFAGAGIRPAASTLTIPIAGRAGVPANASAVALNVTVDGATEPGFVTVYPCNATRPTASNLNYAVGETIAVLVIARLASGSVCAYNSGTTHLIVDVTGSFDAGELVALDAPKRLADSRPGQPTADGAAAGGGVRAARSVLELPVSGRVGIPANVSTVVLTVTAAAAREPGHITVYPCGVDRPVASNVNYGVGETIANTVVAHLGAGGAVCLYTKGATDVVVDVAGWVPASVFTALTAPARLLDTRTGEPTIDARFSGLGRRPARSTLQLPVTGRADVPASASAVLLNVTAVGAGAGFVTLHPAGAARPVASNLNYVDGQTVANAAIVRVGTGGGICLHASADTHLIVDVVGWFAGPAPPAAGDACPAQQIFPNFRIVALYGNATAPPLGVLGEQSPEAAAARLEQLAAPWRAGDRPVLGAFEMIATIANATPGPSGLFRSPSTDDQVQRYLDAARAHGLYLIIDIQPGTSDFLTEVRRYEKFLRQPDVGLALDPEWHVRPGQTPGRTVGQVSAADVNEVADYLAGIVAQDNLPEKLMVVHQFQVRMLTERSTLRDRAGVALTIHMDGFGTRGEKLTTYQFVHADPPFHNGFKLFLRQDIQMFNPAEVLALNPVPDLITYQ